MNQLKIWQEGDRWLCSIDGVQLPDTHRSEMAAKSYGLSCKRLRDGFLRAVDDETDYGLGKAWAESHSQSSSTLGARVRAWRQALPATLYGFVSFLGVLGCELRIIRRQGAALFELSDRQQTDLFLYAMRYALGRRTDVAEAIAEHWDNLNERSQNLILRDLREAIAEDDRLPGRLGDGCDREVWDRLLKKLEEKRL